MKKSRIKFQELPQDLRASAIMKATKAGFKTHELTKLYFKVVNNEIVAFSETNIKDQPE